jgi:hypothetical protein
MNNARTCILLSHLPEFKELEIIAMVISPYTAPESLTFPEVRIWLPF